MIELSKQVGELAKQVMIKEKYYALQGEVTDVDEKLGNEMADVIAQVMRLADHYQIDLEKNINSATKTGIGCVGCTAAESILMFSLVKKVIMPEFPDYFEL